MEWYLKAFLTCMSHRVLAGLLAAAALAATTHAGNVFETPGPLPPPVTRIDQLVAARWQERGVRPAALSSDAVFLRRAFLDSTGTLPSASEAAAFLASPDPHKRAALIDSLLAREEFADYWALKWSDLLRIKAEFPINLWPNAAQAYYHWIRAAIGANRPYDRFAADLLTASGSNFRSPPANFYRAMQNRDAADIARIVALTFLGARAEKWPAAQQANLAAFFSRIGYKETGEWKEEIVYFDARKPASPVYTFPDGSQIRLRPSQDPREAFAQWLTAPGNRWFARAIVNRIWYWLLGRGIVEEPDDLRDDNPPENPALLACLESELTAGHYDLKHIFRLVMNSQAYQLSALGPPAHFAAYPLRRLDAEVLADALSQITLTSESYSSSIPEPYTFMPDFERAATLPDGSISSAFLELFGRPARDTGLESERANRITDEQRLHLLNSTHIQRKLQQSPRLQAMMREIRDPRELVNQIYLTILSRYPTEDEWKLVQAHSAAGTRGQAAAIDLAWALINSTEFLYRH